MARKSGVRGSRIGRLWWVLGLAFLYYVAGRISLLLAIPPGYAAPVWPGSGLALGAFLLLGYRMWPGIFLGSFLVNIGTDFDATSVTSLLHSLALPSLVGAGATLQALLGSFLVHRTVRFPISLERLRDTFKIMLMGGPVSCTVNATVGVASLLLTASISRTEATLTWWTWWFGDSVGVLVLIPLISAWSVELSDTGLGKRIAVAVPVCVVGLLTVLLFLGVRNAQWQRTESAFRQRADHMGEALDAALRLNINLLYSVEGLFSASETVERQEFRHFSEDTLLHYQGIQALEWVPRVPGAERAQHEQAAQLEGLSDFRILELDRQGQLATALARPEYFPVYYVEPYKGNEASLGFDLASNTDCRTAMHRARDTGIPAATGRLRLIQESDAQFGILVFLPVYHNEQIPHTVAEHQESIEGYVCGIFRIGDLVDAALAAFDRTGIDFQILDDSAAPGPGSLLVSSAHAGGTPVSRTRVANAGTGNTLDHDAGFAVGGRHWTGRFTATATYFRAHQHWGAWTVLTVGLLFTGFLGTFVFFMTGQAALTQRAVVERTVELTHTNTVLAEEIAERQQAEQALREARAELETRVRERSAQLYASEQRYRYFVRQTAEGFYRLECEQPISRSLPVEEQVMLLYDYAYIAECNDAYARMYGFSDTKAMTGTRLLELHGGRDNPENLETLWTFVGAGCHMIDEETQEFDRDGNLVWLSNNAVGIFENDCLVSVWGTQRDITQRKRAEEALTQRVEELAALNALGRAVSASLSLDQVGQAVLDQIIAPVKPDLTLLFLRNGDHLRLQGMGPRDSMYTRAEITAHRVGECLCGSAVSEGEPIYCLDIRSDPRCTWTECKQAGLRSFAALPLRGRHEIIAVLGIASAVERDFSALAGFLETLADQGAVALQNALLYEQIQGHARQLEQRVYERTTELAVAKDKAEDADRLKSAFLAAMSHELRTPLNSIIGFTGILMQEIPGPLNTEQHKQLGMVRGSSRHLLNLINDVLDISKIEAGQLELQVAAFDMSDLVAKVKRQLLPLAEDKGLVLTAQIEPEVKTIVSDQRRVEQILINLVNNAVKFTEQGQVTITCRKRRDKLVTCVQDTGMGIRPEERSKLFKPFQQLDTGLGRIAEGTGLGLSICQKLVEMLGGEIRVESQWGRGSTFSFVLPQERPA